ncbi:hypothetical protein SEA_GARDENB_8 [Microbacterium phage GardenB]|nr:hypothetical protein SEA_GARDENB_8 [Microbacterium phage GardenB]
MANFIANVTLTGGWGAHENARSIKHYYTWRKMVSGSNRIILNQFTSQYYHPGYCSHWQNLAYAITIYLRNSAGSIVSSQTFNDEQHGVAKYLTVPATGNYAYSFELWHPGDPIASPWNADHSEQYYMPDFSFASQFTSNTD